LDAARGVLGRKGVEGATIADITGAADVGFGSFYNHFESKKAILEAAVADFLEAHNAALDRLTASVTDPARSLALSIRQTVGMADRDRTGAEFVVRFGLSHRSLRAGLGARSRRDLREGIKTGRFTTSDPAAALVAIGGGVIAVLQARLDGTLGAGAESPLAETVLRMLGVAEEEAARIAREPLPETEATANV
jgi:AcrR family transcriptional regulator